MSACGAMGPSMVAFLKEVYGLPRHDMEVEGVVVKDDAILDSASVAAHAMLRRMSLKDEATIVFHEYFNAGCCDMRNLSAPFARP